MRYLALAADYDGTLASDSVVATETIATLQTLRASGRRIILNTGRQLDDLLRVFPQVHAVDRVVAENGGVILDPSTGHLAICGAPPPAAFVAALRAREVPFSVGRVIVATDRAHEQVVRDTIRNGRLPLHVVLNKGAVMVLPNGIDKASGLRVALAQLQISPAKTVAIGDAENDESFLRMCGCSVAVANAVPELKARANRVMTKPGGEGVVELIEQLVSADGAGRVAE